MARDTRCLFQVVGWWSKEREGLLLPVTVDGSTRVEHPIRAEDLSPELDGYLQRDEIISAKFSNGGYSDLRLEFSPTRKIKVRESVQSEIDAAYNLAATFTRDEYLAHAQKDPNFKILVALGSVLKLGERRSPPYLEQDEIDRAVDYALKSNIYVLHWESVNPMSGQHFRNHRNRKESSRRARSVLAGRPKS
ncbi:MAG: hypothetical protein WAR24_05605 [Candidatus Acidiferrales bacterium]